MSNTNGDNLTNSYGKDHEQIAGRKRKSDEPQQSSTCEKWYQKIIEETLNKPKDDGEVKDDDDAIS